MNTKAAFDWFEPTLLIKQASQAQPHPYSWYICDMHKSSYKLSTLGSKNLSLHIIKCQFLKLMREIFLSKSFTSEFWKLKMWIYVMKTNYWKMQFYSLWWFVENPWWFDGSDLLYFGSLPKTLDARLYFTILFYRQNHGFFRCKVKPPLNDFTTVLLLFLLQKRR